jgi:CheY-like chemotaxis protein
VANILIVDDSAVDRHLIEGLLANDGGLNTTFAANGKEAWASIADAIPELVVTDLHMPEMNGFELLTAVMNEYPLVPVIVVTSRGNEEIAVQALKKGAASYVPKRMLRKYLLDTVYQVLEVADQRHRRAMLLEGMNQLDCGFVLKNNSNRLIAPLVGYLQDNLAHMGLCSVPERTRIAVALQEALSNALYHGNLEVNSELRDADPKRYDELIERRRTTEPYQHRGIHVEARLSRDKAVFVIRDEGPGFDVSSVADPTEICNLDKPSGRGLLLMRTFMTEVRYNDVGNQVTLIKRLNES